jgi:hypothetical protein
LELAETDPELRVYVPVSADGIIGAPRLMPPLVSLIPKQDPERSVAVTFVQVGAESAEYLVVNLG